MKENQELSLLYQYQEIRRRQLAAEKKLAGLASDRSLDLLTDQLTMLAGKMASCTEAISHFKKKIKKLEDERTDLGDHRGQSEGDLYGGKITSPKELTQLERKIEEYRQAEGKAEEELLQAMYSLEEQEKELNSLQAEHTNLEQELKAQKSGSEKRKRTLQDEVDALKKEGDRLATLLSPELKARFDRLSGRMNGLVLAPVKDNTCGSCHVLLSPGILEKVRRGGASPPACENCGRLLVIIEGGRTPGACS